MIKKVRDVCLGDKIGGRTVACIDKLTDPATGEFTVYIFFADVLHLGQAAIIESTQTVWVDDPEDKSGWRLA